jgi:hypothetical protein
MKETNESFTYGEKDGLRLLGISRIPQCGPCERLAALMAAYRSGEAVTIPLPPVPPDCGFEFCAPVAARFIRSASGREAAQESTTLTRDEISR